MTLFDAYLIVDWSASSKPRAGKDSIWIANATRHPGTAIEVRTENPRTRTAAQARLEALLDAHTDARRRVLVGCDFPYGYPGGFAASARICLKTAPPWLATWNYLDAIIQDDEHNANNRFAVAAGLNAECGMAAGPFWGCPKAQVSDRLNTTGHDWSRSPLRRYRHTERRLRGRGSLVQEVWKLWTTGSVGSQALLGIPRVASLRRHPRYESFSLVWPFETGFRPDPIGARKPAVLHVEIWPGIATIAGLNGRVRDDVQVDTLARHFLTLDEEGRLGRFFDRPQEIGDEAVDECVNEEGWILGA